MQHVYDVDSPPLGACTPRWMLGGKATGSEEPMRILTKKKKHVAGAEQGWRRAEGCTKDGVGGAFIY
jgi:hypothetical protein